MSITIVIAMHLTPDAAEESRNGAYTEIFKATRSFKGCESIHAYEVRGETDRFMVIEQWASAEDYEAYLAWRRSTGFMESSAARMASPPKALFLDEVA